jgi:polysaccharide deacetylase family protein (PEP-CTERM system associated)
MPLTVTLDLEDSTGTNAPDGRWVAATERFLDELDEAGIRATVFVVGDAAEACGSLIRRVADAGHEIGLHGMRHVPLAESGPDAFPDELIRGRAILQDLTGQPIEGFRAPIFSLTPNTAWAVEQLHAAGFAYSSSILPARNPLHGWPGLPRVPFRWDIGLLEFPCPVLGLGPTRLPYLGGIYLRYVPAWMSVRALRQQQHDEVAWSYVHPYDLDPGAPIRRFPHANWPTSLLLHTRRRATMPRLRRLTAATGVGRPLAELAAELMATELPRVTAG